MIALREIPNPDGTVRVEWDPRSGAIGFRFRSSTTSRWSHTFDPTRTSVRFSKAAWYEVEELRSGEKGRFPAEPVPAISLPAEIRQGGTYSGTRDETVKIRTSEPVLLDLFSVRTTHGLPVIDADHPGVQLTTRRGTIEGGLGHAIYSQDSAVLDVQNCNIVKTWGIRPGTGRSGCVIRVNRNRFLNQQYIPGQSPHNVSHPFQAVECRSPSFAEVAWNEFIQEFGRSQCEDVISIYDSSGFKVHDNFLRGAYPAAHGDRYSGGGILVDSAGGADNVIADNVCIQTMNYTFAIASGERNTLRGNRGFCTSKDDTGRPFTNLASGGNGMVCWPQPTTGPGNRAYGNVLGILMPGGGRNDWMQENGLENDLNGDNIHYSGPIDESLFQAEYASWKQRVSDAGITVGA